MSSMSGGHTDGMTGSNSKPGSTPEDICVEVWAWNLEDVFVRIRQMVLKYPYIVIDTEFPGIVARPIGEFRSSADYQYQLVKCNVDLLKLIKLELIFYDDLGNKSPGISTFQFNFKFSLSEDMYAQDSIDKLQQAGTQFKRHEEEGIAVVDFAELLISSGLVLTEDVTWIAFTSYDFGYLLRALTNQKLPDQKSEFFQLRSIFLSKVYYVMYLMNLKKCVQQVIDQLMVDRVRR